ncbi:MAG TPA: MFS transporter [Nevskiaceae bacterium]|nr:MFS transporter [Nevskiaceae bacterium]
MSPASADHRRLAVVLAGAAAFVNLYAPQSLLPVLQKWIGNADAALAGLIVSAGTLGVALAAPFAGLLADRLGKRRVIVLAALLVVIPGAAIPLAQTPQQLIAARFIEGLFLPGIFAVTVAYIGSEFPVAQARAVTSLYVAGTIGGGFCGRLLSGLVTEFAGWRWGFAALALMQLLLALAIRAWLPAERPAAHPHVSSLATLPALLRRPELRGVFVVGFMILFALVGGFTYVSLRLAQPPFSLGPAALSAIFVVYLVSMTITALSGVLLNRYGHARVLALAWGITVLGLLLSLVPVLWVVCLGLMLFSAGLFIAQTTSTSFVGEAAGAARAPAVGLYVTCYYAGGSVGGVLPAPLWNHYGWSGVVALLCIAGVLSVSIGWRSFQHAARPAPSDPAFEAGGEAP